HRTTVSRRCLTSFSHTPWHPTHSLTHTRESGRLIPFHLPHDGTLNVLRRSEVGLEYVPKHLSSERVLKVRTRAQKPCSTLSVSCIQECCTLFKIRPSLTKLNLLLRLRKLRRQSSSIYSLACSCTCAYESVWHLVLLGCKEATLTTKDLGEDESIHGSTSCSLTRLHASLYSLTSLRLHACECVSHAAQILLTLTCNSIRNSSCDALIRSLAEASLRFHACTAVRRAVPDGTLIEATSCASLLFESLLDLRTHELRHLSSECGNINRLTRHLPHEVSFIRRRPEACLSCTPREVSEKSTSTNRGCGQKKAKDIRVT